MSHKQLNTNKTIEFCTDLYNKSKDMSLDPHIRETNRKDFIKYTDLSIESLCLAEDGKNAISLMLMRSDLNICDNKQDFITQSLKIATVFHMFGMSEEGDGILDALSDLGDPGLDRHIENARIAYETYKKNV